MTVRTACQLHEPLNQTEISAALSKCRSCSFLSIELRMLSVFHTRFSLKKSAALVFSDAFPSMSRDSAPFTIKAPEDTPSSPRADASSTEEFPMLLPSLTDQQPPPPPQPQLQAQPSRPPSAITHPRAPAPPAPSVAPRGSATRQRIVDAPAAPPSTAAASTSSSASSPPTTTSSSSHISTSSSARRGADVGALIWEPEWISSKKKKNKNKNKNNNKNHDHGGGHSAAASQPLPPIVISALPADAPVPV
ncbi:hypothetical protein Pelo_18664 [Pelomyxa schiedti]|nr:hypothetical protein Pelo_18664 [Pelomyxa schiedti]